MDLAEYLSSPDVRSFIEWVAPRLCTDGAFTHRYRKQLSEWSCTSIFDAYRRYDWHGDFESNQHTLEALSTRLRTALDVGDSTAFIAAGSDVLRWGGVIARNGTTLAALGEGAISVFRGAMDQLAPRYADTDQIENVRLMNAGFTKLYALLLDDFPIYDGRVGAAIGYLVRLYLQKAGATTVPKELRFPWGVAKGSARGETRKNRNPSSGSLVFPRLTTNVRIHTRANIMAAWLLGELSTRDCFGQLPAGRRLRALEAALFMIGYEISAG
ncbi:MAG TPA: hypothetical protein VIK11_14280 [Tepidiformaceae bacterium]